MAFIALSRGGSIRFLAKFVNQIRPVSISPTVFRSFNTNADSRGYDDDEHGIGVSHRRGASASRRGQNLFDPFSPRRSVSELLEMMDQFFSNPIASARCGIGATFERGWDAKEDNDGLYLRMDMPGLGKEDVKVSVEHNTLVIRGEAEEEGEEDERGRRYSTRIELTPDLYKGDQIKAEMKNGVLKVVVPKVREEERKDVGGEDRLTSSSSCNPWCGNGVLEFYGPRMSSCLKLWV